MEGEEQDVEPMLEIVARLRHYMGWIRSALLF